MFYIDHFYLQDQSANRVVSVVWLSNELYQLDDTSFDRKIIERYTKAFVAFHVNSNNRSSNEVDDWHLRLGHASFDSLNHS